MSSSIASTMQGRAAVRPTGNNKIDLDEYIKKNLNNLMTSSYPHLPLGHCWDFFDDKCKYGTSCRYKHNARVKNAFLLRKNGYVHVQQQMQQASVNDLAVTNAHAKANSIIESTLNEPELKMLPNYNSEVLKAVPKNNGYTWATSFEVVNGPGSTANDGQPPSNSVLASTQTPINYDRSSWEILYPAVQNVTAQAYAAQHELANYSLLHDPKANTEVLQQEMNAFTQPFNSIWGITIDHSHVSHSSLAQTPPLNIRGADEDDTPKKPIYRKSAAVVSAEAYKAYLLKKKIHNKVTHAELDVIIAGQYWDSPLNDPEALSSPFIPPRSEPLEDYNNLDRTNTKSWGPSDYLLWARQNLTDLTTIKLVRTYCDQLEDGTAPAHLFARMGKKAPEGATFMYFQYLPFELRETIWLQALAIEKNDVRLRWLYDEKDGHFRNTRFYNANNQQRLLFVNHELRALALKKNYKLAFGTHHSRPKTYFDFKRDRLFLHSQSPQELIKFMQCVRTHDAERVQTLAIPLRHLIQGRREHVAINLCRFTNVKKIHLVCGDGIQDVTFCRAGSKSVAKDFEIFLYNIWRRSNSPYSFPRVRMYMIPAIIAHEFKIDNLLY